MNKLFYDNLCGVMQFATQLSQQFVKSLKVKGLQHEETPLKVSVFLHVLQPRWCTMVSKVTRAHLMA